MKHTECLSESIKNRDSFVFVENDKTEKKSEKWLGSDGADKQVKIGDRTKRFFLIGLVQGRASYSSKIFDFSDRKPDENRKFRPGRTNGRTKTETENKLVGRNLLVRRNFLVRRKRLVRRKLLVNRRNFSFIIKNKSLGRLTKGKLRFEDCFFTRNS